MTNRPQTNVDRDVAEGFGREWRRFTQNERELSSEDREAIFNAYFSAFPWHLLPADGGVGIDVGCGSGRWAAIVAPRVAHLHLLDASPIALGVARENLSALENVSFHCASANDIPLPPNSLDFAFSLGVLHHVPDTRAAIAEISSKLKPGAPFLVYLYYAFDNRPNWYRLLWLPSNALRRVIVKLPYSVRFAISQVIAAIIYWPLARAYSLLKKMGAAPNNFPLSWYYDKSFYVMRTDAYDRLCTKIEKRFTKAEIEEMLLEAGFSNLRASPTEPYWCMVGIKR